jgi:eukaryotic-like serine/threonine-protein kinase
MTDPDTAHAEGRLDEVLALYLDACRRGQPPDRAELMRTHPDLADGLSRFFADQDCFVKVAAPLSRPAPAPPAEGGSPLRLGSYEVLGEIARGGMGVVYRARQQAPNRVVALKVLRERFRADPDEVRRFRQEAEAAARLQHPNIVPIYEVGEHEGLPFFSMKLIEGGSLAEHKARFRGQPRACARLLAQVARAVHHAHQHRVLHRDLKPANILLEGGPDLPADQLVPHVSDFGLAKQLDPAGRDPALPPTRAGDLLGTPTYMAPEQAVGQVDLTTAVDVWGLGAILYELLTGTPPFQADTPFDTLIRVVQQDPVPPHALDRKVDRDLETVALKCLAKDPGARYGSAEALADDLDRWLAGRPIRARRTPWRRRLGKWVRRQPLAAALLLLLILVASAGFAGVLWKMLDEQAVRRELARALYDETLALAERELFAHNVHRAEELLEGPACPPEVRGWEWRFLRTLTYPDVPTLPGTASAVFCVAWGPHGRLIAAGGDRGTVHVWDGITGQVVRTLTHQDRGSAGWVRGVAFSPRGDRLASAGSDGTVIVWDTATWRAGRVLRGHTVHLWCVAFSHDGKLLASGGGGKSVNADGEVIVWDVESGRRRLKIACPRSRVWKVAFHPARNEFAFVGDDGTVRLWDAESGAEVWERTAHDTPALCVCFSPDGSQLATSGGRHQAGDPGEITLRDARTGAELRRLRGHADEVWGLSFSPDGTRLASSSHDQTIKLWDAATGRQTLTLRGHRDNVRAVAFSPGGLRLLSAGEDQTVRVWEASPVLGPALAPKSRSLPLEMDRVWCIAYSPDGGALAFAGDDRVVRLWDPRAGQTRRRLEGHAGRVRGLAFDPTGRVLASASYDDTVRVWDLGTGQSRALTTEGTGWVHAVAFTPDGRRIAAVSNYTVRVWGVSDGRPLALPTPEHDWVVSSLAFRPERADRGAVHLATGSWDQTIRLWDVGAGKQVGLLEGHKGRVRGLAFSPDGKRLASVGNDGTVRLWDVGNPAPVATFTGHGNAVVAVAYGPDGRYVASASQDQTVRVWDTDTGRERLTLRGHLGAVHAVAFRPDGRELAVASGDEGRGEVRLWDLSALGGERRGSPPP